MAAEKFFRDDTHRAAGGPAEITDLLRGTLRQVIDICGDGPIADDIRRPLRRAVRAFAMACRNDRMPPEATLVAFKQIIREAGRQAIDLRPIVADTPEHELITEIIRWCIEDYYAERQSSARIGPSEPTTTIREKSG